MGTLPNWLSLGGSILELAGLGVLGWEWWKALLQAQDTADRRASSVSFSLGLGLDLDTGRAMRDPVRDDPVREALRNNLDVQRRTAWSEQENIRADNRQRRNWYIAGIAPIALGVIFQGLGSALTIMWPN